MKNPLKLLVGTKNKGKIIEIKEVLGALPIQIVSAEEVGIHKTPDEFGQTFKENAISKAQFYFEHAKMPTIADDSGIIVEAMNNELGVNTRRWGAGPQATDEQWIRYFLDCMSEEKNKRAHFVCHLAYVDHDGTVHTFEGKCSGTITEQLEADFLPGLPISACFKPDGYNCVYSAMKIEQKNSTSHRGQAVHAFRNFLASKLGS